MNCRLQINYPSAKPLIALALQVAALSAIAYCCDACAQSNPLRLPRTISQGRPDELLQAFQVPVAQACTEPERVSPNSITPQQDVSRQRLAGEQGTSPTVPVEPSDSQSLANVDGPETQHVVHRLPPVAPSGWSTPPEIISCPGPTNGHPSWPQSAGLDQNPHSSRPPGIPAHYEPWWTEGVVRSQRASLPAHVVGIETLVVGAITHSPQIRADTYLPLAQEARIIEAQSEFDLRAFMESTFDRPSDPVGNALTTGGPSRFREQNWSYVAGARKKTICGGSLDLSQRIGFQDNNSEFFTPPQQGNSRLVLSFTQPLLRGAGQAYNTSRTVLAHIDTAIAWDHFSAKLQDHLLQVTRAYWQLYQNRATLLQRHRLYEQACAVLSDLEGRRTIDSARSQIIRARAAVASRRSDLTRAQGNIQNAEARIRQLVGAPELSHDTL